MVGILDKEISFLNDRQNIIKKDLSRLQNLENEKCGEAKKSLAEA